MTTKPTSKKATTTSKKATTAKPVETTVETTTVDTKPAATPAPARRLVAPWTISKDSTLAKAIVKAVKIAGKRTGKGQLRTVQAEKGQYVVGGGLYVLTQVTVEKDSQWMIATTGAGPDDGFNIAPIDWAPVWDKALELIEAKLAVQVAQAS